MCIVTHTFVSNDVGDRDNQETYFSVNHAKYIEKVSGTATFRDSDLFRIPLILCNATVTFDDYNKIIYYFTVIILNYLFYMITQHRHFLI